MEIDVEIIKRFFAFMNERHAIYLRRQRGEEWPWTADPILQKYSFTNVYRQLDRGTQWLTTNIIEPHADEHELLFFNIVVYRCHNRISTADRLGYIDNYDTKEALRYETWMQTLADMGEHIFTNAYMVTGSVRENGVCPKSKVHQMFGITFPYVWNHLVDLMPLPNSTLEEAFNRLALHAPGIGRFNGFEIITDLRHTHFLNKATDIMTWANPGPGCRNGLGRIIGRTDKHGLGLRNTEDCLELMRFLLTISPQFLASYMYSDNSDMQNDMRFIEHSLCEYSKYERIRLGGRARRRFVPPHLRK